MTTIMTWGNSEGTKGRCDASCHNAKYSKCVCMCGGRYHGAAHQPGGVEQAVHETWEDAIQEAERKAKAEGMELDTSRLRKFIGLQTKPGNIETQNYVQGRLPLEVASV